MAGPSVTEHQCCGCTAELEAAVTEAEDRANVLASRLHEARTRAGGAWAAVHARAPAEEIVAALRFLLREPEPVPYNCFGPVAGLAEEYQRRFGEPLPDMEAELRASAEAELGEHRLASNEAWAYSMIHRVVFRHSFFDHDCQTTGCKAMFLWNSREMTQLLLEAYERGQRDGRSLSG